MAGSRPREGLLSVRQVLARRRGGWEFTVPKTKRSKRTIPLPPEMLDRQLLDGRRDGPVEVGEHTAALNHFIDRAVAGHVGALQERAGPSATEPSDRDDEVGRRIQAVLDNAADFRKRRMSNTAIAMRLAEKDSAQKCQDFGHETVRKILDGRYRAARVRGLPGLRGWLTEKYQ